MRKWFIYYVCEKMKDVLLILITIVLSLSTIGQENEERRHRNSISVDLARPILTNKDANFRLFTYERAISDKFSALVGFGTGKYANGSVQSTNIGTGSSSIEEEYIVEGPSLLLEGRFYPLTSKKIAPRGLFVGTYFKNFWLTEDNITLDPARTYSKKHQLRVLGIDMGYQFGKSWFLFEPVLGFGGTSSNELGKDPRADSQFSKFEASNYSVRFGLNIGVCF